MEFLLGLFMGPFILFGVLWAGLAWWAWLFLLGGLCLSEIYVIKNNGTAAFFWLMVTTLLIANVLLPDISNMSWYAQLWVSVKLASVVMVDYLILGVLNSVPLWFWFVRKRLVSLRAELNSYVASRAASGKFWFIRNYCNDSREPEPLTPEQIKVCAEYRLGESIPEFLQEDWSQYRRSELRFKDNSNKFSRNLDTISSFIFLWPFHYIFVFFGDILAKIPEWFARYFGPMIDTLTRLVRFGIPDNIDR